MKANELSGCQRTRRNGKRMSPGKEAGVKGREPRGADCAALGTATRVRPGEGRGGRVAEPAGFRGLRCPVAPRPWACGIRPLSTPQLGHHLE